MPIAKAQIEFQVNGHINAVDTSLPLTQANMVAVIDGVALNGVDVAMTALDVAQMDDLKTAILTAACLNKSIPAV